MKEKLTLEQAKEMTWVQMVEYYFPKWTRQEVDYFIWNETCFPFAATQGALDQLYEHYLHVG